ncbi:MAG: MFS transporter [Candidatus Korobacteraceae bacterium]
MSTYATQAVQAQTIQPDLPEVSKRQIIVAIVSSVLGFSLDLFDYSVLLYVASTIGPLIFPSTIPTLSLAGVFAAYATSAVSRPFGAAIFGNYADRHGRKRALFIAAAGVGILTASMGAMPTVRQVGLLSPILFLILRLAQGFFVGGVPAATHTIGTETVPPSWRGWTSGLIGGGGHGVAQLLCAGVFLIMSSAFPGPAFAVWGWRCMFFTGFLAAFLALYVLYNLIESPLFVILQKKKAVVKKAPVRIVFSKQYRGIVLVNTIAVFGGASMSFVGPGYTPTFLAVINHLSRSSIGHILLWGGLGCVILPPLVGQLSEMYGRRKAFWGVGILGVIVYSFAYTALANAHSIMAIAAFALPLIWLGDMAIAPTLVFLNERFPTAIRATGTAMSWNLGFAIGSFGPLIISLLSPKISDIPSRLMWYSLFSVACLIIGPMLCKETRGHYE